MEAAKGLTVVRGSCRLGCSRYFLRDRQRHNSKSARFGNPSWRENHSSLLRRLRRKDNEILDRPHELPNVGTTLRWSVSKRNHNARVTAKLSGPTSLQPRCR